jgi:dTDP-4-amino-4,6-dideoxygalactose transaminase
MIPYSRQLIEEDDIEAVVSVLRSDYLTQGPVIEAFEAALASYAGARHAVLFSSGTAALHAAYSVAGIAKGDVVLTSPITFAATANAALYSGATPVFIDVEADTGNMDVTLLEQAVTRRTKAIVPVHYAGLPVDMEAISRVAGCHGLVVIEDACHALGAEYRTTVTGHQLPVVREEQKQNQKGEAGDRGNDWFKVGSCAHSDMTVFSFHPVKQITTGEGGAVLTNRADYCERLRLFRTHGITKDPSRLDTRHSTLDGDWYYEMQLLGFNYRMTDLQAALGLSQLRKLDRFIERRREIAVRYRTTLGKREYLDVPPERGYARSSYHLYPVRLNEEFVQRKKAIFSGLRESGLGVQVHYIPVYLQPYYELLGYKKGLCPAAEGFYRRELSIPLHQGMDDTDVQMVIEAVDKVFRSA